MDGKDDKLLRVAVFYDGGYFSHVNDYYRYAHTKQAHFSFEGIHEFVRYKIAALERVDCGHVQIVDAHYFRGRLSAKVASHRKQLYSDRVFDDTLMYNGIVTHYLPIPRGVEKGVDVWLALEAFELAVYKRYDVLVLLAGDSDFLPLVRKINALGTRVMVLGWNFEFMDKGGKQRRTVVSSRLLDEVTYPMIMNDMIDSPDAETSEFIDGMFCNYSGAQTDDISSEDDESDEIKLPVKVDEGSMPGSTDAPVEAPIKVGQILKINDGYYGFIECEEYPDNVFFHASQLINSTFQALAEGQVVRFEVEEGARGMVANNVEVIDNDSKE